MTVLGYLRENGVDYGAEAFLGIVYCFFGYQFMVLIAAVEAFRLTTFDECRGSFIDLYDQFMVFQEANREDDRLDEDKDGVADVLQITGRELLKRKVLLFLRAVDPKTLGVAFGTIYTGFLAVFACLKLHFAHNITLGVVVGDIVGGYLYEHLAPILFLVVPKDYHKWIRPGFTYGMKFVGVVVAFSVQRRLSMLHSALRGGQLFASGLYLYLEKRQIIAATVEEGTPVMTITSLLAAAAGVIFQVKCHFTLPFLLRIAFAPLLMAENMLSALILREIFFDDTKP